MSGGDMSGDGTGGGLFLAAGAEPVDSPPHLIRLLADGSDTGMSFSVIRVDLRPGFDGAAPHAHSGFAELLYVIDGAVEVLSGEETAIAGAGDLVVVPAGAPHAFGALKSGPASLLAVIGPGIDRFQYFRELADVANGAVAALAPEIPGRYDSRLVDSPAWRRARSG
jgi:quercetin dioxygenase-like cupin family protein